MSVKIRLKALCVMGVAAEYPSIGSYNPEKAGYMDTQLSPANALRTRNTYVILALCLLSGYAATRLRSCEDHPSAPRNLVVSE